MGRQPVPSKAAIKGHPLHPVVIPFPIAFGTSVVFTDLAYSVSDARAWAVASVWLLWATLATGLVAGALGAIDYFGIQHVRELDTASRHGLGNAVVLVIVLANGLWRLSDLEGAVLPIGILLSVVAAAILGYTGYLGGELSYKHLIGANPSQSGPESPLLGSRRPSHD
jgi:uncharacterized membrane protein